MSYTCCEAITSGPGSAEAAKPSQIGLVVPLLLVGVMLKDPAGKACNDE
jgi:hypothetical protein